MTRPYFADADASGNWPRCSRLTMMNAVTDLRQALDIFGRATAVRRVRTTLAELSARAGERLVVDAYSALAGCDSLGLRRPAPISRAREPSSILMVGQQLARRACI